MAPIIKMRMQFLLMPKAAVWCNSSKKISPRSESLKSVSIHHRPLSNKKNVRFYKIEIKKKKVLLHSY